MLVRRLILAATGVGFSPLEAACSWTGEGRMAFVATTGAGVETFTRLKLTWPSAIVVEKKIFPYEASIYLTRKMCTARQITVPEAHA